MIKEEKYSSFNMRCLPAVLSLKVWMPNGGTVLGNGTMLESEVQVERSGCRAEFQRGSLSLAPSLSCSLILAYGVKKLLPSGYSASF